MSLPRSRRLNWQFVPLLVLASVVALPIGGIVATLLLRGVIWGETQYMPLGEPPAQLDQGVHLLFALIGWFIPFALIAIVTTVCWYRSRARSPR